MKNIKFRAWQKYHKKMVEVISISFDDTGEINEVTTFVENQAPQRITYKDGLGNFFLTDEHGMVLELMQYTGLKDKNGVCIYEGDIIEFVPLETSINNRVVKFEKGVFKAELIRNGYSVTLFELQESEIKVVGNIYQNKDLLEEKE